MKKSGYPFLKPPAVAIAVGVILLLGGAALLPVRGGDGCHRVHRLGDLRLHQRVKGRLFMKIVVLKSPKCLSGLLRLIFGIKKETNA